jgi:Tfp pilus assembly protein PilO
MQLYQNISGQYNKANPTQKNYLNIGLTLGLLILLIGLVFPALNHILKLNKEISEGKNIEAKLQDKVTALQEAETNYTESKDRLKILDDALPTGSSVDTYFKQIERFAGKNNSTIAAAQFTDIPLSKPANKTNLKVRQFDYTLTLEGKFTNLVKFLTDFEQLVRTTDFTLISVNKDESKVSASIKATGYYLGEQAVKTTSANQPENPNQSELEENE